MSDSPAGGESKDSLFNKALRGDVQSQFQLACNLEQQGQLDVASAWYKSAALRGNVEAAFKVGMLCLLAEVSRNDAFFWFHKAAAEKHAAAAYQLSLVYQDGIGVKVDNEQSLRWLREAVTHGSAEAQSKLNALSGRLDRIASDEGPRKKDNLA